MHFALEFNIQQCLYCHEYLVTEVALETASFARKSRGGDCKTLSGRESLQAT